jgi:hypothetical protein
MAELPSGTVTFWVAAGLDPGGELDASAVFIP